MRFVLVREYLIANAPDEKPLYAGWRRAGALRFVTRCDDHAIRNAQLCGAPAGVVAPPWRAAHAGL
jgi:hypothetical protein